MHPWRMASLEALFAWIRRNSVGLHARRVAFPALQLAMPGYRTDDDAADEEDEDEFEDDYTAHAHRAALVGACLAALACPGDGPGGSSLQHLWLRLPSSPASLLGFPAGLTALTRSVGVLLPSCVHAWEGKCLAEVLPGQARVHPCGLCLWPLPSRACAARSLAVEAGETVRLGSAVRGLGALRRLDLRGSYLEGAANIPAGVTSLALVLDGQGAQLPAGVGVRVVTGGMRAAPGATAAHPRAAARPPRLPQVTQLALRSLTLERCSFEEQELAGLTRLTCLEHLGLVGMQVPDCLRELTWLGSLRLGSVYDRPGQILAPLGASPRDLLAPLARLTALALHSLMLSPANLAATLLSLPQLGQLQRLALCDTQDRPGRLDTCLAAGWRMHAGRRSIGIYCTAPLRPWPPRIPCSG